MHVVSGPMMKQTQSGLAYCPICTHTVETLVIMTPKGAKVKPGERCPRCHAHLEPAVVIRLDRAA